MVKKIKKWWFNLTHYKCDYCNTPIELYYDAYLFSLKEYKGHKICTTCIDTNSTHPEQIIKI
jgi:hypothetical protein